MSTTPIYEEVCQIFAKKGLELPTPQDMNPSDRDEAQIEGTKMAIIPAAFAFGIYELHKELDKGTS